MSIVYATDKMTVLMDTDAKINEGIVVATSAMGSEDSNWAPIWKGSFRDRFDLYCVTARDDAASNKLVGMFCFGDIDQYELLHRSGMGYPWVITMRDTIVAKGIEEAKVDAASAIYVHADYTGQGIATTMMGKRATFQVARGITHALSFAYESTDIKNWSASRTSAEAMGTDGDGNPIYLFDLSQLTA
jgi:GNAT superfamily N-acetyltransferase